MMIFVENLTKEYKTSVRKEGFLSGVRNLFNTDYNSGRSGGRCL
jgi:hypothetical protein